MLDATSEQVTTTADSGEIVILNQSGGTAFLRNGILVTPLTAEQAAQLSLTTLGANTPWLAPLVLSAVLACSDRKGARFINEWGNGESNEDPEKYEAYTALVRDSITAAYPWLMALFDSSGALILANPGMFSFNTLLHMGVSFDVPELLNLTYLTPFAADGDVAH